MLVSVVGIAGSNPGRCVMKDKMVESYIYYINSDTVILLIDTAQGFISHKAKAFLTEQFRTTIHI